jgi:hypothetical protein
MDQATKDLIMMLHPETGEQRIRAIELMPPELQDLVSIPMVVFPVADEPIPDEYTEMVTDANPVNPSDGSEPIKRIPNKTLMYALFNAGKLGNTPLNYDTLEECLENVEHGLVGMRCRRVGGPCIAMKTPAELMEATESLFANGWRESDFTYGESPAHQYQTLQGEVQRSERYLDLTYTTVQAPMRQALAKETKHASGLEAKVILEHYLDPNTYADIMELLDTYDGAVVEFTAFDRPMGGRYKHRNALIWEVRNY